MNLKKEQEYLLNLISYYLFDNEFDITSYDNLDYQYFARIIHEQKMESIVFCALDKLKIHDSFFEALRKQYYKVLVFSTNQEIEYQQIKELFENNGIDYVPLKGTVMKHYYPNIENRIMGDIDILIPYEKRSQVHKLLLNNGYSDKEDNNLNSHHEIFTHGMYGHFEIHFRLLDEECNARDYIDEISWKETFNHQFTNEFNIVYQLAHYANHFTHGGASFKSMLDIALLLTKEKIDEEKLLTLLKKTNYLAFYNNVTTMINYIFNLNVCNFENSLTLNQIEDITKFIFKCGDFGFGKDNDYSQQRIINDFSKKGKVTFFSKLGYIIKSVCIPYRKFKQTSKVIKYVPILLPFGWIVRLIKYSIHNKGRVKEKLNNIKNVSNEDVKNNKLIDDFLNK